MFTQKPAPYLFKGGNASDYVVFEGDAGTWCTKHLATGETIQSVRPAIDMLNIANLGLNILNVGIGVYNAFQLRTIKKELKQNHQEVLSYFSSVESALNIQYRTLELLIANQKTLEANMQILREEMRSGFQNVMEEIKNTEVLRQREEFETRTFKLLKVYERFTKLLPELSEVEQLIERAENLEAWVRSQLNRIEAGKAERLPLFVALTFSIRAKADGFEAKGGEYIEFARKEINLLINDICSEVYELCQGRKLYTLGVEMPEILYQYTLLNRSLHRGLELQNQEFNHDDIKKVFSTDEIVWDDGMEELRQIFTTQLDGIETMLGHTNVHLRTLSDYEWYIAFSGEDREIFNVHSISCLEFWKILNKVGYTNAQNAVLPKSSLNTLMNFALPKASNKIESLIQQEFKLETAPKLFYRSLN